MINIQDNKKKILVSSFIIFLFVFCVVSTYADSNSIKISAPQSWVITNINDTEAPYDIESVSYDGDFFKLNIRAHTNLLDIPKNATSIAPMILEQNLTGKDLKVAIFNLPMLKNRLNIKVKDNNRDKDIDTITFFDDYNRTTGIMNYTFNISANYEQFEDMIICTEEHICDVEERLISYKRDKVILKLGDSSIYVTAELSTDLKIVQTGFANDTDYVASLDVSEGKLFMGQINSSYDLTDGLVGWWSWDNNNTWDYSGINNHGNVNPGTLGEDKWKNSSYCQVGRCLNFDGVNDYVQLPSAFDDIIDEEVTVIGWFYQTKSAPSNDWFIARDWYGPIFSEFNSGRYLIWRFGENSSAYTAITSGSSFDVDTWYHVAITSKKNGRLISYYNSVVDDNVSQSYKIGEMAYLRFGQSSGGFTGMIDQVKIYNRTLSASEISDDYQRGLAGLETNVSSTGLVLWTKLNESSPTDIAEDDSGNGYDGVLHNYPPEITNGKLLQGMDFDGVEDYIGGITDESLNLEDAITISLWVKYNTGYGQSFPQLINREGASGGYRMYTDAGSGQLYILINNGIDSDTTGSVTPVNENEWTHIVWTYNGSYSVIYLNGTETNNEYNSVEIVGTVGKELKIGGVSTRYTDGIMDDIRIYNRVLSAVEISELYNITEDKYETNIDELLSSAITYDIISNMNTSIVVEIPQVDTDIYFTPTYIAYESSRSSEKNGGNNGLVGCWNFNYPTGSITFDCSGYGSDGVINSAIFTDDTYNNIGHSIKLDGVNDYISIPISDELNITGYNITISFWLKHGILASNRGIIDRNWGSSGSYQIFSTSSNDVTFQIGSGNFGITDGISNDVWYHFAYTQNSTHEVIYVNGVINNSGSGVTSMIGNDRNAVEIGRGFNSAGTNFNGTIDNVQIWNRPLSATEIIDQYSNDLPRYKNITFNTTNSDWFNNEIIGTIENYFNEPNLTRIRINNTYLLNQYDLYNINISNHVTFNSNNIQGVWYDSYTGNSDNSTLKDTTDYSQWVDTCEFGNITGQVLCMNFNELYGTIVHNRANNSVNEDGNLINMNTGVNNGNSGWTRNGYLSGAIEFDGINDYINIGNDASITNFTDEITVSGWIKTTKISGNTVISHWGAYNFWIYSGVLQGGIWTGDCTFDSNKCTSTTLVNDDIFHHFVLVYNSTEQILYIDNVAQSDIESCSGNILYDASDVFIGAADWGSNWFDGTIDEVKIFNKAKDQDWITAEYELRKNYYDHLINQEGVIAANENLDIFITNGTTPGPRIQFVNPTQIDNYNQTSNYTYINWTVEDTNIDTVIFNWNGVNTTMVDYYSNESILITGAYTYYVWANDTIGNENQTEIRTINIGSGEQVNINYTSPIVVNQYNDVNINISKNVGSSINYTLPYELSHINVNSIILYNSTDSNITYTLTDNIVNFSISTYENYTISLSVELLYHISTSNYSICPALYIDYGDKCRYVTSTDDRYTYYYSYYVNVTESNMTDYNMQILNKSQSDMTDFGSYNLISLTLNGSNNNITEQLNNSYYNATVTNDTLTVGLYEVLLSYFVWTGETVEGTGSGPPGEDITPGNIEPNVTIIQPDIIIYKKGVVKNYTQYINITNHNEQIVYYYIEINCIEGDNICEYINFNDETQSLGFYLSPNQTTSIEYYLYMQGDIENTRYFNITLSVLERDNMVPTDYTKIVRVESKFIDIIYILDRNIFPTDFTRPMFGRTNITVFEGVIAVLTILVIGLIIKICYGGNNKRKKKEDY